MRGESRMIIGFISATILLMGLQFMFTSLLSGIPMPPQTYGQLVYEVPAELWSGVYILFPALIILGCYRNNLRLIWIGSVIGVMVNVLFSMAAGEAEFGYLLEKGSFIFAFNFMSLATWIWLKQGSVGE